jgi:uncharacterized SAM-binding protein YcdF (DUF218 family)
MFFTFSKLFAFVITPLMWIITLLFFSLFSKDEKRRKKCLRWALGLTLFFSNSFIFDECIRLWEIPATHYEDIKQYNVGIVLGGMSSYDPEMQRAQFFRGVDRLLQAIELYKRGTIKKIIFTGGSGSILHPDMKEGVYITRYLDIFGVPEKDFLIESESKNTRENAILTRQLLDQQHIKGSYLLITSASHMRRSLACFRKVGIEVTPYSTDRYAGPRKFEFDHLIIPAVSTMNDWNTLLKELVGFTVYKIMGYA